MAVNKNFVVKNGLEVNSNLLIADLDSQTVGIGTTIAPHELHVVGGIGVTNLNVTGVATIANLRVTGPSTFVGVTTFTDNNVFIDKQLFVNGISITGGSGGSIGTDLVVERHVRAGGIVTFSDSLFVGSGLGQSTGTSGQVLQVAGVSSGAYFGGQVGIGTTNPAGGGAGDVALHVVGDSRFVGLTTFTGITTFQSDVSVQGSLKVTGDITYDEITGRNLNISGLATFQSLTAGRVALVGTGDTLTDNPHLLFNSHNRLIIGGGTSIGGATTIVGSLAQSGGLAAFTSSVSANSLKITDLTDNRVVIVGASSEIEDDANFVFDGSQLILGVGATVGGGLTVTGATDLNGALDVSGETNFSSGVGIADSIFHIGDDNTQIRFPAADTVTVETGGDERLRVDSAGRLLLGTTTEGNASADNLTVADSANSGITIRSGTSNLGSIFFSDATSGNGEFAGFIDYNHSSNQMSFGTAENTRATITSGGDVGIGTITPTGSHAVTASNEAVLAVGVVTAREYYGDGSNLSGLPQSGIGIRSDGTAVGFGVTFLDFIGSGVGTATVDTASGIATVNISGGGGSITINNNADNRLITGSGTVDTLEGEADLTFDGTQFAVVSSGATVGGALTVAGATDLNGALDVSGETNFSSGVGIADSIFHVGDDNTQIRFPVADTVTVETGGTERVRITSTGALAIEGASNYGTSGQVLTSNGNDAPTWQDGGGISEVDTTVSTVNPTGVGSFATANFRSASVIAQINQLNTDFQVGRYLMIHDGTTVTVIEESAVSTGSTMLGSFTGVIDGSNVELRVTLASAGVSTITTKIDTVTV